MPPSPTNLPHHRERTVLTILRDRGDLPLAELYPVGVTTVMKMVEKKWVKRVASNAFRITPEGEEALKRKLSI